MSYSLVVEWIVTLTMLWIGYCIFVDASSAKAIFRFLTEFASIFKQRPEPTPSGLTQDQVLQEIEVVLDRSVIRVQYENGQYSRFLIDLPLDIGTLRSYCVHPCALNKIVDFVEWKISNQCFDDGADDMDMEMREEGAWLPNLRAPRGVTARGNLAFTWTPPERDEANNP